MIPEGVTVMGGYNEGSYEGGEYVQGSGNWDKDDRNAAEYMTVLSAVSDEAGMPSGGERLSCRTVRTGWNGCFG